MCIVEEGRRRNFKELVVYNLPLHHFIPLRGNLRSNQKWKTYIYISSIEIEIEIQFHADCTWSPSGFQDKFLDGTLSTLYKWTLFQAFQKKRQTPGPLSITKLDINRPPNSVPRQCMDVNFFKISPPGPETKLTVWPPPPIVSLSKRSSMI